MPPDSGIEVVAPPPRGRVSRETEAAFETYHELLLRWQSKMNLVAPGTLAEFRTRHIDDSLQILDLALNATRWLDLGSGAGFPGLVIAIAQSSVVGGRHMLVEANAKKCAFLREVVRATGARAEIVHDRIESATKRLVEAKPQIVTARALAPLGKLLKLLSPMLAAGATALVHKGRDWRAEVAECNGLESVDLVVHQSRVEPASVVLELRQRQAVDERQS